MTQPEKRSLAESLALLPDSDRQEILSSLSEQEAAQHLYDWRGFWARPNQVQPGGDWRFWVLKAGRGFGKTLVGGQTVREWAEDPNERILLVAPVASDVREVMIEGPSGLLQCYPPERRPVYNSSRHLVTFPSGAIGITRSADEPERLRGPQFTKFWADELCLAEGTMIRSEHGEVSIENIRPGMKVWTRNGLRPVVRFWRTTESAQVYRLTATNGATLAGTAGHPVMANGRFVPLLELVPGDTLETWQTESNGAVKSGGSIAAGTGCLVLERCCIAPSTPRLTDQYPRELTSTTSMEISSITPSPIWRLSRGQATIRSMDLADGTPREAPRNVLRGQSSSSKPPSQESTYAPDVARDSQVSASGPASARLPVSVLSIEVVERRTSVYNLEVQDDHEYFANGILTHNCAWRFAQEAWDQIMFGFRLPTAQLRGVITTTPKPIPVFKKLLANASSVITSGSSYENRANLSESYYSDVIAPYEGTRLGRQEILGEVLDDTPGALWKRSMIDATRVRTDQVPWAQIVRTVVAIDPAVTAGEKSDETGIVVGALLRSGHGLILDDLTCRESPLGWAKIAVGALFSRQADRIVGERNNGGDLIESNLRSVRFSSADGQRLDGSNIPYRSVWASRGKATRAEPVSALYEQGRIHHVGSFGKLEDEMCAFVPGVDPKPSPNRMDAMVWLFTELFNLDSETRTAVASGYQGHRSISPI